jgi:hypothetical protein
MRIISFKYEAPLPKIPAGDLALASPGAEMVVDAAPGPARAIAIKFKIRQYPVS